MAQSPYQQLEQEFRRLHAFRGAASLLRWDSAVMMPRGSADVRGEQLAALDAECHALLTSPRVSRLIDRAQANQSQLEDWQLANLREMRRERDHAIATPLSLVTRLARATSLAEVRWLEARQENNFALLAPHLEEVVALTRDKAQVLSQALGLAPYDSLIDEFSPGFLSADIDQLFKVVIRRLPSLIREAIELQAGHPPLPLAGKVGVSKQRTLALEVMRAIGFPFDRGRLDESSRAFTEGVWGDVRIATRYDVNEPFSGLMGVLHEIGQAMYDLGLPAEWRDQPVGRDRGMALEESQSLLLEMIVGRSRAFLTWLRPLLEKHFGCNGPAWEVENLYRTLTLVRRSAIRADADELTYPVHIMLRYDLEKQIFEGTMPVRDLPEAWRAGFEPRLGLRPCDRHRRLPAGRALGARAVRLLPFVRARLVHRGTALREPARGERALRRRDRRWPLRRPVRVAAAERARTRCERRRAGTDQGRHRPHAVGGAVAALCRSQVPRVRVRGGGVRRQRGRTGRQRGAGRLTMGAVVVPAPATARPAGSSSTFKRLQARLRGLAGKAIEDFRDDRGGRPRDGLPVRRQGLVHAARRAAVAAAQRPGAVRPRRRQPRPEAAGLPAARAAGIPGARSACRTTSSSRTPTAWSSASFPRARTMCGLCSRLRRGALYRYASENGVTKVALGHHRDDIVETMFLNMFFGGRLKTMPPKLLSEDGRHIVIRPLAYVPEREIERYARARAFPIIPCTLCGSQEHLQRVAVKKMLADWEREHPGRTEAIFSALCNVSTSHLADPRAFDFEGLEARRAAALGGPAGDTRGRRGRRRFDDPPRTLGRTLTLLG